jgi:hypothetical protein
MRLAPLSLLPFVALLAACDQSEAPAAVEPTTTEAPVVATAPVGPLAPRNDCATVPGAQAFLDQINAAVAARDVDAFVSLVDVHVRLGFGGEDGAANLRTSLEAPDGGMWDEIAELMAMGCAVTQTGERTTIILPWYFAQDTGGDPFETMIVTGEEVVVHAAPAGNSEQLATISWDAVQLEPEAGPDGAISFGGPDDTGWRHVRLPASDGAEPIVGYMRSSNLRSVIDYRLLAENGDGTWKVSALLAGD